MPLVTAFVVLPTASRSVRICAPSGVTSPDISAMPCALSLTGPNVSMATMTPTVVSRPQPGQRDEEQGQADRAAGQQEHPADRRGDDARGVDGGLEADADARQDDRGRTGERGARDVQRRLARRAREVPGDPQDDARQHDADGDRDRRDEPRVAGVVGQAGGDAVDVRERGRQVDERRDGGEQDADERRDVEAAVDGRQAGLGAADARDRDAQHGDDRADRGDDEREHEALLAERRLAQDEGRDERHRVGLEQVRGHARAVAHVVADVVGDRGRVARVVLGDALLDLADEVGADVGRLGEDAAADPHEHREQRGTEAEALEHRRRLRLVDQDDGRGAEQAETDHAHADEPTGPERDPRTLGAATRLRRGGGDPQVRPRREPHAQVPDGRGEHGADEEEDRPPHLDAAVARQQEQERADDDREDRQGAELPAQVRRRPFLDRLGDVLHLLGALTGREHLATKYDSDDQRHDGDRRDDTDDREARGPELDHASSSTPVRTPRTAPPSERPRCRVTGRV